MCGPIWSGFVNSDDVSTVVLEKCNDLTQNLIITVPLFQEKDAYRSTMCDLFADTKGFSAKTMNAINKEVLYKVTTQHGLYSVFFFRKTKGQKTMAGGRTWISMRRTWKCRRSTREQ